MRRAVSGDKGSVQAVLRPELSQRFLDLILSLIRLDTLHRYQWEEPVVGRQRYYIDCLMFVNCPFFVSERIKIRVGCAGVDLLRMLLFTISRCGYAGFCIDLKDNFNGLFFKL